MDILLLRHGESVNNTLPEHAHIPDPPLTARGRAQAERLAAALAPLRPDVVICSPLLRSLQTAAPLAAGSGVPWLCWADVVEVNRAHPDDGQPLADLQRRYPGVDFEPGMPWPGFPGRETGDQATARADRLSRRLEAGFPAAARVAVVGHGGFNAFLLRSWLGAPQDGTVRVVQGNTCINVIRRVPGATTLLRYNDCGHLA